jgi:hypothetical protein
MVNFKVDDWVICSVYNDVGKIFSIHGGMISYEYKAHDYFHSRRLVDACKLTKITKEVADIMRGV